MLARTETISVLVYPATYNLLPYPFTNNYIIINKHGGKAIYEAWEGKNTIVKLNQ